MSNSQAEYPASKGGAEKIFAPEAGGSRQEKGYQINGASFAYNGVPALHGLNIGLPAGKFYGVVGPNGCGKTTFLDLLVANKRPDTGTVSFNRVAVNHYKRRDLARQVALVPQDFAIGFAFTVEEVVLMGRHPHIKRFSSPSGQDWQFVEDAMATIGISQYRQRYVNELSGGEKQRVVVARSLAQNTAVLLFDEATANLDVRYTLQIFNVARALVEKEGRTVIAVIHNLNLAAAYCDEILFMKKGRILEHGPVAEVMEPAIISEVFGVESEVRIDPFNQARQVSFKYQG
ncbi:MAG: ABC transporter ATP-binding protein [Thermodesulfobacteriota bacterium]